MIRILKNLETQQWHWQVGAQIPSEGFQYFNHAVTDLMLAVRLGAIDPEADARLDQINQQQAEQIGDFIEQTLRDIGSTMQDLDDALSSGIPGLDALEATITL